MIVVAITSLIMSIFDTGYHEFFYIDKLDKGVNKYVVDKERKKEAQVLLKEYEKALKDFDKNKSKQLKEIKEKNLDKNTTSDWYDELFNEMMVERVKLQQLLISQRIQLQELITDSEWALIIEQAKKIEEKTKLKEQKKDAKGKSHDAFDKQVEVTDENLPDGVEKQEVIDVLIKYQMNFLELVQMKQGIRIGEDSQLGDKYVTKENLQELANELNEARFKLSQGFLDFLNELKEITNEEEWTNIMKEVNKGI